MGYQLRIWELISHSRSRWWYLCLSGVKQSYTYNGISKYEIKYNLRISLIDQDGLIQVASDAAGRNAEKCRSNRGFILNQKLLY